MPPHSINPTAAHHHPPIENRQSKIANPARQRRAAFSLIELLVSCAVLALLLVVVMSVVNHSTGLWQSANTRIEAFQSARLGFENLTRLLSQATLNTYWDYHRDVNNIPQRYIRKSELHFLIDEASGVLGDDNLYGQAVFFQAPANFTHVNSNGSGPGYENLTGLLNACGFFVEFASDADWIPEHVDSPARNRFRLMQWMEPTESLSVYDYDGTIQTSRDWIVAEDVLGQAVPAAENVILLLIWPREPEGQAQTFLDDSYTYDSRLDAIPAANQQDQPITANQLPPLLQVAMVAIDESSAVRLGDRLQSAIEESLEGRFQSRPGENFAEDLAALEEDLTDLGVDYRVFVSAIPMHEAKWSVE